MVKTNEIIKAVFYLALTALGVMIGFIVYWTNSSLRNFGILWWCLIGYGSYMFSDSVTKLFFQKKIIDYLDLNYKTLKTLVGRKTALLVKSVFVFIFIITFGFSMYLTTTIAGNYANDQLTNYGEKQKVLIRSVNRSKGGSYANFEFSFNGKTYSERLPARNYNRNDTATVIFSTHNPDVICWADEFTSD